MTQTTKWWHRKRWQLVSVGVVALLVGFIGGIWGSAAERDSLQNRLDAANAEIEDYSAKHDDLVASGEALKERMSQEWRAVKRQRKGLTRRSSRLDARAAKVEAAEATVKRNTITDGIWQVGVDFDAGTYRASGSDCYWEKLASAGSNFDDLLENGSGPNQTVTIDSAWFSSQGCGKWTKIG